MYINKFIKVFIRKIEGFDKDVKIYSTFKWPNSGDEYECRAKTLHLPFVV